ncbi:MAG: MscS Mechanosensitive ion channel [Burkholderiales bacterium]|jgi:small-conductance mechanosensitive channel|nr:MscS Mechanosensitive ion channel [Burkholderiales bacterium]
MHFVTITDGIIVLISFLLLGSKLLLLILNQKIYRNNHITNIARRQPYITALIILITYMVQIIIEYYFASTHAFFKFNIIAKSMEVLRVVLFVVMLLQEESFLYQYLYSTIDKKNKFLIHLLPPIHNTLKICLILITLPLMVNTFNFNSKLQVYFDKLFNIFIIWIIVWLILQVFNIIERLATDRAGVINMENFDARRITTKAKIFKRIAIIIVMILGAALTFMTFDKIRTLGTSLLASAGLITAIVGFAAQKTLSNFLAGIQIALNQPIKIGDSVIVEGEYGTIEEILLTYVVIRLWDLRAMIVPIDYFLSKTFLNYTRNSINLLCVTYIYLDYSISLAKLKEYLTQILSQSTNWDGKVNQVNFFEPGAQSIKVRLMASSANPNDAVNLKYELHEKMIELINLNHPDCLPCIRVKNDANNV